MAAQVTERRDQPDSNRAWSIETNGINPIPDAERQGKPVDMFWVWCFANIAILGIAYGGYLVAFYGLNVVQGVVAAVVGTIASFLLVGFISLAGKIGGAPTFILSRAAFGVRGNVLPTAVSYISLVGWETILVALATLSVAAAMDRLGLPSGKPTLAVAFVIIAAITIAIGMLGQATIVKVATWFTYAFAILTVVFFVLEWSHIDFDKVSNLPSATTSQFIAGVSIIMAGLGIGWVNAGADYSRYLPRSASSRAVVGWTTFGASIAPIILITFGLLVAAGNDDLANSSNPVGVLVRDMPTWFVVPYMLVGVGGLVAGAVLDIYSSGLNLLSLGVRLPRYQSVAIDGTLMIIGNIYILFFSPDFFGPFQGFLITLGVLLASWSSVFLVDMWMLRLRRGYDTDALFDSRGRYGPINPAGVVSFLVAGFIGLGLVTSTAAIFKPWVGYLLVWLPFLGGKDGAIGTSSIGLLIAFAVGGILYAILGPILGWMGRGRETASAKAPTPVSG
jgi:nucleobase:cation symporter-1, NCS1 family